MIEFSHLNKTFVSRAGKVEALKDVSLTVENGDICGVIGFSGAGKSTLIRMANLLERPDSGSIKVDGVELTGQTEAQLIPVRRKIGMVFQQFNLLESRTVAQNIEIPMKLAGIASEQRAARVKELLQFVELSDKANTYVSRLSGGQKQRVGIARALALSPSILLCDEATSALDPQTTESILALLKKINRELGVTILLITHQMQVVQRICNKVAVMENGRIVEQGTVLDVFGSPKQEITRSFVRAIIQDEVPQSIQKIVKADGKSQGPYTELFEAAIVPILEKEGYTVEGTDFSELLTADIALNDGEVDVNVEQHTAYAENFNASYNGDLTPISPIPTVPAGIFSDTHTSLDEIADGAKVAVPNDASNTARAYVLLQKAGWITLDSSVGLAVVTQDDIVENPHNIEFTEMASLNIPSALQDFDYAVITGSIVYNAGIDASTALLTEDVLPQLILQVVVKKDNADTDWAKAIVAAYHSDEFKKYMDENNNGLWYIPDELK